jgi:uncharacterized protein
MVAAVPTSTDELAELAELLRDGGGRFAFLHGSRVVGGSRTDSDLDVAVWFGRAMDDLTLRARLPAGVDLLVLDEAPLELAGRVALHGRLLDSEDLDGRRPRCWTSAAIRRPPARLTWPVADADATTGP